MEQRLIQERHQWLDIPPHPKYSYSGALYSSYAAEFDTALEIDIAYMSSFIRQGSLSLAGYTNTKTHKSLFRHSPRNESDEKLTAIPPHRGT